MKIKIRPDDVGTPGGNEWAEMNGWLADLRDDSADGQATAGERGPADAEEEDPADISAEGPVASGQAGPADAEREDPAGISQGGTAAASREGRASDRPAGPAPAPTSWSSQRYPAPARSGVSGNARPLGRARAARTGPPAGAPVRAVIGDELRMPIMWCEMDSCISWHADRTALGEADVRARAIRAGWRIDALGRLACPQCQQTKVAFRATRPVVLWDRATAIAMAARATAPDRWAARLAAPDRRGARATAGPGSRPAGPIPGPGSRPAGPIPGPGSRPAGPIPGPYGRDPRHQATGPR
jgi:hypothetical protein